jgi:hypothetical protein
MLIKEILKAPEEKFKSHLTLPYNSRIIFSGQYGSGKTTFLNYFFGLNDEESSESKTKYDVVRLFPVNYSIASNEDILNFIKYDTLLELIKKEIVFEELGLETSQELYLYGKDNWGKIGLNLLKAIAAVGKSVVPTGDYFKEVTEFFEKEYNSFTDYAQEEISVKYYEGYRANSFMELVEKQKGSIYEQSIIQKIIEKKIQSLKGKENHTKKTVLIIDDLDRIDPEHIFRILNVFAAHFDFSNDAEINKFGFDKIILVCDINNIRNIFHHKYGAEVNFSGYIDKFYTEEVFVFDNEKVIRDFIYRIATNNISRSIQSDQNGKSEEFSWLLNAFIKQGSINLRSLMKLNKDEIKLSPTMYKDRVLITETHFIIWKIQFLSKVFGDKGAFLKAVDKLTLSMLEEVDGIILFFEYFLLLATIETHNLYSPVNPQTKIIGNTKISYSTINGRRSFVYISNLKEYVSNIESDITELTCKSNIILVIKEGINKLYEHKILV